MKVLVTGGAGYIGSHVVQALLEAGHEPVVYDNLSTGHAEAVKEAELVVGDLADRDRLSFTLAEHQFDGAVNLAAVSLVGESMRNPARYFSNNVVNGLSLFDNLLSASVPWVVLSSTAAVYGEPDEIPISETHRQLPTNPYGESKLNLERILAWYDKAYEFRSVALRYFNAAGAHPSGKIGEDHDPETHLIPIVLQTALGQRDAVDVFGSDYATSDGTAVRDYVHVCDLAAAHVAAMEQLKAGSPTTAYNLGSQHGYSVMEIVEMSRRVTGKEIPVRIAPRRAGDPPTLVASAEKVRVELGWRAGYELEGIVDSAWRWHVNHPSGYR